MIDLSLQRAALDPRSIAVLGASENPNKVGGRPLRFLTQYGFQGRIYPINPRRSMVQGLPCWPALEDLPEAPELVIVAVAGDAAFDAVRRCADMGVRLAVIMAGGLTESDPLNGKDKERAMVAYARDRGMRIIGPNSQGIANFGTGAIASFSTMFVEVQPLDGPVGIVSQSGAMSVVPYGLLRRRGIGIRHSHATGNDCDVTACEMAALIADDPGLRVLLLYLEGLPDPEQLAYTAEVARKRRLPIIAVKGGSTTEGQIAAASHTGALATEDRVIDAFFEQHGIWRARDMEEMVEGVELYLKGWRPQGRKLAIVSTSGATCVMAADAASSANLPLAEFQAATTSALRAALPPIAQAANPVDVTGALLTDSSIIGRTLNVLASAGEVDAVCMGFPVCGAGYDVPLFAQEAARYMETSKKPLIFASPQLNVVQYFHEAGVPIFSSETRAVAALGRYLSHMELMEFVRMKEDTGLIPGPEQIATYRIAGLQTTVSLFDEAASLAKAAAAGIPVVEHRLCTSPDDAISAWRQFGSAVVVKGCSSAVAHKSELGIVRLGLSSEESIAQAWLDVTGILSAQGFDHNGALVARMLSGAREMIIGAHRDPTFGVAVVFGDGGKYVEAVPDLCLMLAPFSKDEVLKRLARLRMAPIFGGVRDEPALDVDAFAATVVAVGAWMLNQPSIHSVDLNPVVIGAVGQGCWALDAVVYEQSEGDEPRAYPAESFEIPLH